MSGIKIFAFSGFLGSVNDWDFLKSSRKEAEPLVGYEISPQLVEPESSWDETCANWMKLHDSSFSRAFVMGYSLGGRMAAQLIINFPERFEGLLAISAHPGLSDLDERGQRVAHDQRWANRFALGSGESWSALLKDWDAQSVLSEAPEKRARIETPELRARSEKQLRNLSLGLQNDLSSTLMQSPVPQTWITGESDSKFSIVAERLSRLSAGRIQHVTVLNQGHRWPWVLPEKKAARLLLNSIQETLNRREVL
jgi:2-succinyl-6-hydroxy-2,4-cyclohexadiene-1-carboxylate synthase